MKRGLPSGSHNTQARSLAMPRWTAPAGRRAPVRGPAIASCAVDFARHHGFGREEIIQLTESLPDTVARTGRPLLSEA
jgi:hypothetical protein